jgi:membrane-bound serine protease (ClpP class)
MVADTIREAEKSGAALILIRLDTPGGLMDATREVVKQMVASPVPVVTWVGPGGARAASAGFFLVMAGDVAAMAPGTRTGAASPVTLSGQQIEAVMRRKIENDASAWVRSLAERRGRNAAAAQLTVTEAKSYTETEALNTKLIEIIASDVPDLLGKLNGREVTMFNGDKRRLELAGAVVKEYEPTLRQRVLKPLSDPNLAFIVLVLGGALLYVEFTTPGVILPGVAGAILLLIGLAALALLPLSWLGIGLILLALGMLVAEVFVTSHGVLGVGGAIALALGAMLLVEGPPEMRIGFWTAVGVALPFAALAVFLASLVLRVHRERASTGMSGMIGQTGVARTPLNPDGTIFVHGEYWAATSSAPVPEGTSVVVAAADGLRLRVDPVNSTEKGEHAGG